MTGTASNSVARPISEDVAPLVAALLAGRINGAQTVAGVVALIERERQAAAVEALREAANNWTSGEWADTLLPKPTPPAIPTIANRMGDWLRVRADRIAGGVAR